MGHWASNREITYTSFADLTEKPDVQKLVEAEIKRLNADHLARVEQVRRFRLLRKELHQDDGELTATQKGRRRACYERYATLISEMYGEGAS